MDGAQAIKRKINFIKLRGTNQDANEFKNIFCTTYCLNNLFSSHYELPRGIYTYSRAISCRLEFRLKLSKYKNKKFRAIDDAFRLFFLLQK